MNQQQLNEQKGSCPYCGEEIDIFVDESEVGQLYIEDCFVCCRPIQVLSIIDETGAISVRLFHENEVPCA